MFNVGSSGAPQPLVFFNCPAQWNGWSDMNWGRQRGVPPSGASRNRGRPADRINRVGSSTAWPSPGLPAGASAACQALANNVERHILWQGLRPFFHAVNPRI